MSKSEHRRALNACEDRLVSKLLYRTDILSRLSTFAERQCGNRHNGELL